jgi:ribosome-associated toxin RatA of RatAB toxin-antitoxin module
MTPTNLTRRHLAALAALAVSTSALPAAWAQEMSVKVERRGDAVVLDVEMQVPASLADTWAVLTDYDHMTAFMPNLKSSTVLSRQGNHLELAQTGEVKFAFMSFSFSSVRAVDLLPMHEIRSHLISGDFKSFDSTTRLVDQGSSSTLLVHHGEYVTKTWVPPIVGTSTMEAEARKQYGELLAEIVRRRTPGTDLRAAPGSTPASAGGR